ncbi:MAG: nicotinamide-nucleotide amidohydrolase family protein [Bacteroidia bacterium]|nr:nicotinamide-nucleotide amidohydrolase family protein [Bacteroidia bacterium]
MLKSLYKTATIHHRTVLTQGIGESRIEGIIEKWVEKLPDNMRISYLPATGRVRLRISGSGDENILEQIDAEISKMIELLYPFHYGYDDDILESVVGKLLSDRKQTLAIAESCTGGYLSHMITSIAGSSDYFLGSMTTYCNEVKEKWIDVKPEVLQKVGAVSSEVVEAMAVGIRNQSGADYTVATSGIAGPDGGTPEKPVGTVWIGFAGPNGVSSKKLVLGLSRIRNIEVTSLTALNMLRVKILENKA